MVAKLIGSDETINLDPLEHQEYWKLFEECAFGNQNPNNYPKLQRLGQAIAAKFEGSPLAAAEIGRRLASDLTEQHWETIAGSQFGLVRREVLNDLKGLRVLILSELPGNRLLKSVRKLSHLGYLETLSNKNRTVPESFLASYHRVQVNLNQVPRDLFIKCEGMDELAKLCGVAADMQTEAISTTSLGRRRKRSRRRAARMDQLLREQ
ncbi:hypothetical protein ZIOFF_067947 [Zingiber officinale]|uniref:Uncharacterized protein n=1 Tax=Zingiber officinale TaxID=94328 RepID=A0A8J5CEP3_ZINOF|nr:hypothetical protein ZIOFF_067947 [Zingiber officinale]